MPPYTIPVTIDNETSFSLDYKGWASYHVDGSPEGRGSSVKAKSSGEGAFFTKGGGTDGLFSGAIWGLSSASRNLFVYCSMPASKDGHVSVVAALPPSGQSVRELVNSAENGRVGSSHQEDTIVVKGEEYLVKVDVTEARDTYPVLPAGFVYKRTRRLERICPVASGPDHLCLGCGAMSESHREEYAFGWFAVVIGIEMS